MTIGVPIVTCLHRVRRIHEVRVRRPVRVRVHVRRIHNAVFVVWWRNVQGGSETTW